MTVPYLIDVHAHLQDEKLFDQCEQIIERANKCGVKRIINAGCTIEESLVAIDISKSYPVCRALVGVHPHNASEFDSYSVEAIKLMVKDSSVVGIGEIGLDYHYDFSPREIQKEVFKTQWKLAVELEQPSVIHVREAYDDFFDCIKDLPKPSKVMLHCFSGNLEVARKALDMGFHFSIGGVLTYPKSDITRSVFKFLPDSQIHLETDCPYLAPQAKRGKTNEPAYIPMILEYIAGLRSVSSKKLTETLYQNAYSFIGDKL